MKNVRAMPLFRRVFAAGENWVELLRRLPEAGLTEQAAVEKILRDCDQR